MLVGSTLVFPDSTPRIVQAWGILAPARLSAYPDLQTRLAGLLPRQATGVK